MKVAKIGSDDEQVSLLINGEEITNIYQSYQIACSLFEQPSGFRFSLGSGAAIADLRKRFRKGDPFTLHVGGQQIVQGTIEYRGASGSPSVMHFRGRDGLAPLFGNTVLADRTFQNETYLDLTRIVLELCGVKDPKIATDNAAARQAFSGIQGMRTLEPSAPFRRATEAHPIQNAFLATQFATPALAGPAAGVGAALLSRGAALAVEVRAPVRKRVTAKVGTRWWDFLQEQYAKVGLFLWCAPDGSYVLSEPNTKQGPSYRLLRQRGALRNAVNVVSASLNEGGEDNHVSCTAYGRVGKGKGGRLKARGDFEDTTGFSEGHTYRMALYDADIKSNEEALLVARRRIAEERRRGRNVTYVVSGHRVLAANAITRAIWTPDTIVDVVDNEYGIVEPLYLHGVTFERNPETTTTLDLSWPEDIVYGPTEQLEERT